MNTTQRLILFTWLLAFVGLVFLHNPTTEYDGSHSPLQSSILPEWNNSSKDCAKSSIQEWHKLDKQRLEISLNMPDATSTPEKTAASMAVLEKYNSLTKACIVWMEHFRVGSPEPILDWRSPRALVPFLAPLHTFLWTQACLAVVAVLGILIMRSPR